MVGIAKASQTSQTIFELGPSGLVEDAMSDESDSTTLGPYNYNPDTPLGTPPKKLPSGQGWAKPQPSGIAKPKLQQPVMKKAITRPWRGPGSGRGR